MPRVDQARNDEKILRAAAQLLGVDPGASMQAVADAAGLSRLSVYRRYADRAALIAALRSAVDAELDAALDRLPSWDGGPETMAKLTTALATVAARYPVALLRHTPGPGVPPPADARIAAVLREGQRAGVLRDDTPSETLNVALFGVLAGVLDEERRRRPDRSPDGPAAARTVLSLLLPGVLVSDVRSGA